jgi:hypothetical protein
MYPTGAPKTNIEPGVQVIIEDRPYIARHKSLLGREGTIAANYFEKFSAVSRVHAKITKDGGRWFITVPAAVANSTMLDGVEMKRDQPYPLLGEHVLKMSEQCVVRLKV